MEMKASTVLSLIVGCLMLAQALALPLSSDEDQVTEVEVPAWLREGYFMLQNQLLAAEKRPKYMETRDLSYFKDLLMFALDELIDEGKVNPDVLLTPPGPPQKRGERLSICVRMSPNGSLVSRPCWKKQGEKYSWR